MSVSGSPVVSGNTNYATGAADNVYLPGGKTITVGTLAAGASIGVTTEVAPTAYAPVTITSGASAGDGDHFFGDASGVSVTMWPVWKSRTAQQSETTCPAKPQAMRSVSIKSALLPQQGSPFVRL